MFVLCIYGENKICLNYYSRVHALVEVLIVTYTYTVYDFSLNCRVWNTGCINNRRREDIRPSFNRKQAL